MLRGVVKSESSNQLTLITGSALVKACILWPMIFVPTCFILFFSIHSRFGFETDGIKQIPTLSVTGMFAPESIIFTYGLHLESVLLSFFFVTVYAAYRKRICSLPLSATNYDIESDEKRNDDDDNSSASMTFTAILKLYCCGICTPVAHRDANFLHHWNGFILLLGLIASFFMSIVGSISLSVEPTTHSVFAFFMYLSAVLHMLFMYCTISGSIGYSPKQLLLHRCCLFTCLPLNVIMMVIGGVVYASCDSYTCRKFTTDLPSALEYSTTLALLVYVYCFKEDINGVKLVDIVTTIDILAGGTQGRTNQDKEMRPGLSVIDEPTEQIAASRVPSELDGAI